MLAASVLAAVLGSVHAFSVFLDPLEQAFAASRGAVSLTYSLALGFLTLAVLFGHRIYARWAASVFVLGVCSLAATGALIAGFAPSLSLVWLGYSLLFGAANGLGYGFGLQLAAQANPGRAGFAMGVVTAAYALGAGVAPPLFVVALTLGGFTAAMIGLAAVLIFAGGGLCHLTARLKSQVYAVTGALSPDKSHANNVCPSLDRLRSRSCSRTNDNRPRHRDRDRGRVHGSDLGLTCRNRGSQTYWAASWQVG